MRHRRLAVCSRPGPALWLAPAALLALAGCGRSVGQVSGKVLWQGQPVAGAELTFQPEKAPEDRFSGVSGEDGAYYVSYGDRGGLPAGRYRVVVNRYTLPNGKPLPAGEAGQALRAEGRAVRQSYAFEQDVAAGANVVNFELTRGRKQRDEEE